MKPSDLGTYTIPGAVAERMRASNGSEAARRKLQDPGNDWALVHWFIKGLPPAERLGQPN